MKRSDLKSQNTSKTSNTTRMTQAQVPSTSKHPSRIWCVLKIGFLSISAIFLFLSGAGLGYTTSLLHGLPTITADTFTNNHAVSTVYDRNGILIGRITSDGDRQPISALNQVSPTLINAFIAAEDKTFYNNIGINPFAIARAFVQDFTGHKIESGASTITQQTVKLAVFPEQQRTLKRKVQEIALSLELNHLLSKDEIMTDYMNWVYMGHMGTQNVYGVKTASELLFHKDPRQLNLAESAFLAAIPNNPSYFSPYQFPQHTLHRQHYILHQMRINQQINQKTYEKALQYPILQDIHVVPTSDIEKYPYLMLLNIEPAIYQTLVSAGVYSSVQQAETAVPTAGYKIYTTIDLSLQNQIDGILQNKKLFAGTDIIGPNGKPDLYEAGVTLIDNQTGGILAIGGGRDYQKDAYDHSDIARQPGSSIKPLLDYAPAIETHQLTAGSILEDTPVTFPGNPPFSPKDDASFQGTVTAREALVKSMNVPAVRILHQITPQVGLFYLAKAGIPIGAKTIFGQPTLVTEDANLASAIGGLTNGVTVQQMTSAYTVFPNRGVWHQSYFISKITNASGNYIYTAKPIVQRVFSAQTAYILTSMLHDVVTSGTARMVGKRFPGQMISGKTGTTDQQTNGWLIGYTQNYTLGIWMGYNHNEPIPRSIYNMKFLLWNEIMAPLLDQYPAFAAWPKPPGIVEALICKNTGHLANAACQNTHHAYTELFIDGTQPTKYDAAESSTAYSGKTLTTPTILAAPQHVVAIWDDKEVRLAWDAVKGASTYAVWRATNRNGPFIEVTDAVTSTSYVDHPLPNHAKSIYYQIYAMSPGATAVGSNPVAAEHILPF